MHRCYELQQSYHCHDWRAMLQGKGIDCLATHPGLAATPLYPKLDKSKPEAVAVNLFEKV